MLGARADTWVTVSDCLICGRGGEYEEETLGLVVRPRTDCGEVITDDGGCGMLRSNPAFREPTGDGLRLRKLPIGLAKPLLLRPT